MKNELKLRWDGSRTFAERRVKHLEVRYTEEEKEGHRALGYHTLLHPPRRKVRTTFQLLSGSFGSPHSRRPSPSFAHIQFPQPHRVRRKRERLPSDGFIERAHQYSFNYSSALRASDKALTSSKRYGEQRSVSPLESRNSSAIRSRARDTTEPGFLQSFNARRVRGTPQLLRPLHLSKTPNCCFREVPLRLGGILLQAKRRWVPGEMWRILVVDDHEPVRRSIQTLLRSRKEWLVCGEVADGIQAVEEAKSLRPDLIIMDVSMPNMNGLEAARIILREVRESRILIISENDPAIVRQQAIDARAHGFIEKSKIQRDLIAIVECILSDHGPFQADKAS